MTKPHLGLLIPVCLAVATMLTGCASEQDKQVEVIRKDVSLGKYTTAYKNSTAALAEPERFTPAQLVEINSAYEKSRDTLTRHYTAHLNQVFLTGDMVEALGTFERIAADFPELRNNSQLLRRVMRVQVQLKEYEAADSTARLALTVAETPGDRADVEEFRDRLARLGEQQREVDSLATTVASISQQIDADFETISRRRTCVTMKDVEERMDPEQLAMVNRYFEALESYHALRTSINSSRGVR